MSSSPLASCVLRHEGQDHELKVLNHPHRRTLYVYVEDLSKKLKDAIFTHLLGYDTRWVKFADTTSGGIQVIFDGSLCATPKSEIAERYLMPAIQQAFRTMPTEDTSRHRNGLPKTSFAPARA